jgi:hypothetical protein
LFSLRSLVDDFHEFREKWIHGFIEIDICDRPLGATAHGPPQTIPVSRRFGLTASDAGST